MAADMVAERLLQAAGAYLLFGLAFAIAFTLRGAGVIDSAAQGTRWTFRILLLPAATMLWPILAARWYAAAVDHQAGTHHTPSHEALP